MAQIRIEAQDGQEAVSEDTMTLIEEALVAADPAMKIPFPPSVESVGPKVSGELVWTAIEAVLAAIAAVLIYIWLRFEWQFSLGGAVAAWCMTWC